MFHGPGPCVLTSMGIAVKIYITDNFCRNTIATQRTAIFKFKEGFLRKFYVKFIRQTGAAAFIKR